MDSETHDQEWAMVNAVGRRSHNSGGKCFAVLQLKRFKNIVAHSGSLCKICNILD